MSKTRVLVFAATKGGTGKSTLSYAVGFEAAKHGSVYFLDLDPQGSLTQLCSLRRPEVDQGRANIPTLLTGKTTSVRETLRQLEAAGMSRDFVIIDTPGSHMAIIRDALSAADVVVLPVQPSPLDMLAQEDVAKLVDEMGKAKQTLFVVNRVDGRTGIGVQAVDRVMDLMPNKPVKIAQRTDYPRASIAGRTAPEINRDAATEIGTLWRAISSIMMKGSVINGSARSEESGKAAVSA